MNQTLALFMGALTWALTSSAGAQGTSFAYQGHLNDGASPASGNYDLRFGVFDQPSAVTTIAGPLTNSAVAISNGVFTVTLDFGAVFNGAPRWLEIGVRPAGSATDFTTLVPRQPLSPTPYAIFASTAASVPNGAITAAKLAPGAAAANLSAGGLGVVAGGGVLLSEQSNAPELSSAGYQKIGRVNLIDEAWLQRAAGPSNLPPALARRDHSAVFTGTELLIWGGRDKGTNLLNTGARYNIATGVWTPITTSNAPTSRANHRAVWTGSEMIVWGGLAAEFFSTALTDTGARYNPATDTWTPITPGGAARQNHVAFWTGTEMVIYGGTSTGGSIFGPTVVPRNDGARYNLAANIWTFLPSSGAPSVRQGYSTVFTGNDLIVWGGRGNSGAFGTTQTNFGDGFRYSLSGNNWSPISAINAPFRRFGHSAVWSGSEMIIWGGLYEEGSIILVRSNLNTGARYNLAANTWSPVAPAAAPSARFGHDAVWTGDRMVVWGGTDGTNVLDSGARYSPTANVWSGMTTTNRPAGRAGHTTLWSGTEMIVWGGHNEFLRDIGGRYHPTRDSWTSTAPSGERSERRNHTALWTGSEVLVWGGFDGERHLNTGGRYVPSLNAWLPIPTNGAPSPRAAHSAVWTGTEMLVWGGVGPDFLNTGARYNPTTGLWTPIPTNRAPTARHGHVAVWTGTQMIVWGGQDTVFVNTGARYNPANNSWTATASAGAPTARSGMPSVWTGTELLVWGGVGGTLAAPSVVATGARYNPAANTWVALPTLNAPSPRTSHRAEWSGTEMLVWGGTDLVAEIGTGARYNRAANTWSAISTQNAPSPRIGHTSVWDGTRMIVWGGSTGGTQLGDGGIYNPQTDGWLITLTGTNTPPARTSHVAAWTGAEMVVHGGFISTPPTTTHFDDTWHYTPPRTMFLYLKP